MHPTAPSFEDRVRGVIYGHAIGDALGLGTEFLSKQAVASYYPNGLQRFDQIVQDAHRRRWPVGAWTDDTDQMLCILDSLQENREVNERDIARRIHDWAMHGGMGIGRTVLAVLQSEGFLSDPHQAAKRVWVNNAREVAANGGVMRTSVLGIWQYDNPNAVQRNAETVCKITHYDPRCVGSCVVVSLLISFMLSDRQGSITEKIATAVKAGTAYDGRISKYIRLANDTSLASLTLDDRASMGYTLKTMGAALWALIHASSYHEGITAVINEGGDADTNAAVAGALLGAKYGYPDIPQEWVKNLRNRELLDRRIEDLLLIL